MKMNDNVCNSGTYVMFPFVIRSYSFARRVRERYMRMFLLSTENRFRANDFLAASTLSLSLSSAYMLALLNFRFFKACQPSHTEGKT